MIISLKRKQTIRVGKLGVAFFSRGIYVYTGSAMNGLSARLRRHMSRKKKLHWHIDYLLASPEARIEKILCYPPAPGQECRQNQRIAALAGATVMLRRFGASDCNSGCASHLFHFANVAGSHLALFSDSRFRQVVAGAKGGRMEEKEFRWRNHFRLNSFHCHRTDLVLTIAQI